MTKIIIGKKDKGARKMNTVRLNQEINREIIDHLLKKKHCTLLTNKNFICEDLNGYSLVKGKEDCCHSPEYVNCPAHNQYINHETIANRRKIGKIDKQKTSEEKS